MFLSPSDALTALGLTPEEFEVTMGWDQRTLSGEGPLVRGYHILSLIEDLEFDAYFDERGEALKLDDWTRLGLEEKP